MKENFDCSKKLMFLITIMTIIYAAFMLREFVSLNDYSVSTLFCKDSWMSPDTDLLDLERESGTVLMTSLMIKHIYVITSILDS